MQHPNLAQRLSLLIVTAFLHVAPVRAERPAAPQLLPESTVAYLRVRDSREFVRLFQDSNFGRMLNDEKIQGVMSGLYGSELSLNGNMTSPAGVVAYIEDQIGSSLDEILTLIEGEICLALVAEEQQTPTLVGLADLGSQETAERLIAAAADQMVAEGWNRKSSDEDEDGLTVFRRRDQDEDQTLVYVIKEGTFLFSSQVAQARQILAIWNGTAQNAKTMADNRRFTSIMKLCSGAKDERPQVSWFFDPVTLANRIVGGTFQGQIVLGVLEQIGVNGLKGLGGSVILGAEEFDTITHAQVLLGNPRTGVIKVLALGESDAAPELWVPNDVANYSTITLAPGKSYDAIRQLWDTISGDGIFDQNVQQYLSDELGFDFEKDLIKQLDGRMTLFTSVEQPVKVNSQATMVGVKLKDAKEFQKTLDQILALFPQAIEPATGGAGAKIFKLVVDRDERPAQEFMRRSDPAGAVVGDYLLLSDSTKLLRKAIATKNGNGKRLADELDYKLVTNMARRQKGGSRPAMISFQRPEVSMQLLYDLMTGDAAKQGLRSAGEDNPFFQSVADALDGNPLPAFEVISQYLAPAGAMVTDDENGIHYIGFSIRRESND